MDKDDYVSKMEAKLHIWYHHLQRIIWRHQNCRKTLPHSTNWNSQVRLTKLSISNFATPSHRFPECMETPKSTSPALSNTEIVDSTVVVTKNVDKYISQILKQYIKETDHYIKNSKDFVNKCRDMKVETDETLILYDVMPLYPSVPQREAFQVFHHELIPNNILETKMKPESVIKLLKHVCKLRISYSTGDCTSKSMT